MKEVEFLAGTSIDSAWSQLLTVSAQCKETCFGRFNGNEIYSTDTLDEAYKKVTGLTLAEWKAEEEREHQEYIRRKKEHEAQIPELIERYRKEARGLILEEQYDFWDEIVPIRLKDLYEGMELQCVLDICKIMRTEEKLEDRLRKACQTFDNQGHSGMSASLVIGMIKQFCPDGKVLALTIRK